MSTTSAFFVEKAWTEGPPHYTFDPAGTVRLGENQMPTKATLNNQHDYITLRVKFSDSETFNLTRSRNGVKVSGTKASRPALDFFDRWLSEQKGRTYAETMEQLRSTAAKSATMQDFISAA